MDIKLIESSLLIIFFFNNYYIGYKFSEIFKLNLLKTKKGNRCRLYNIIFGLLQFFSYIGSMKAYRHPTEGLI